MPLRMKKTAAQATAATSAPTEPAVGTDSAATAPASPEAAPAPSAPAPAAPTNEPAPDAPTAKDPATKPAGPVVKLRWGRIGTVIAVLGVAVVFALGAMPKQTPGFENGTSAQIDPSRSAPVSDPSAAAVLDKVIADAEAHRATTGTFAGFVPTAPSGTVVAGSAANTDTFIVAMWVGETCAYTGVLPGQPRQHLENPQACDPAEIAALREVIEGAGEAPVAHSDAAVTAAVDQVRWWANHNGGSFAGMPADLSPGVLAAPAADGSNVSLRLDTATGCVLVQVDAATHRTSSC